MSLTTASQPKAASHPAPRSCNLSADQKDVLIEAVRSRPVIWDTSLDGHQEVQSRREAFSEIAVLLSDEKVQYSGQEMQTEWKKLRDIFNRTLKKVVSTGHDSEITWRYWDKLQFISENEKSHIYVQKWSRRSGFKRKLLPTQTGLDAGNQFHAPDDRHDLSMVKQHLSDACEEPFDNDSVTYDSPAVKSEADDSNNGAMGSSDDLSWLTADNNAGNSVTEDLFNNINQTAEYSTVFDSSSLPKLLNDLNRMLGKSSEIRSDAWQSNNNGHSSSSSALPSTSFLGIGQRKNGLTSKRKSTPMKRPRYRHDSHRPSAPIAQNKPTNSTLSFSNGNGVIGDSKQFVKTEQPSANTTASSSYSEFHQMINGQDQFDVFGMFMASQLRTISAKNPSTGLKLKKALVNLCLQFESDAHGHD